MRKICRTDVIKIMLVLALVAGTGLAVASVGRFEPTHMITKEVYCGSCHPEEVQELNTTTHLNNFASDISTMAQNSGVNLSSAQTVSDACEMCHSFWDNFPNIGVSNFSVNQSQRNVLLLTDIYGNTVSPSGLATTYAYNITITAASGSGGTGGFGAPNDNNYIVATPWQAGIGTYEYTNATTGTTYDRLDYVWSNLSSISPMPATYRFVDPTNPTDIAGCDSAEKGMCHIAKSAIVQAELGHLPEASTLFRHEMAYTTDQYAAKPVKICGACHVDKLPPMTWGGEPWSQGVIQAASANNGSAPLLGANNNPYDPFGFQPAYDSTGFANVNDPTISPANMAVTYKTPDWAHANVPCIRCHEHAGINGATVSSNAPASSAVTEPYNKGTPSLP